MPAADAPAAEEQKGALAEAVEPAPAAEPEEVEEEQEEQDKEAAALEVATPNLRGSAR